MAAVNYISLFLLFAGSALVSGTPLNITAPPVTDWGEWGRFERCPNGTFVQGAQLRTQKFQGPFTDDTAVNALRLFCGDPFDRDTPVITSTQGTKGDWGGTYSCYPGFINGFQLRVEPYQGNGDDTSTNNMRIFCSNGPDPNYYVELDGLDFGLWGEVRRCFTDQAFDGLQTQVEDCDSTSDCTALNRILVQCGDRNQTLSQL